ncbi:unnamed protein product [Microthlaspi erraticum]|uniref:Reverse transcriptase domain-containing protein n=2 Tax=Microthlaspi erraticum TaxID=1685480 RepID=A0A6D2HWA0_9BRAS|nr:unnamed protein product [Microthlaspi erraticum]
MHVWSFEIGLLEHSGAYGTQGAWRDLAHGSSSTGYAKEEGRSHLEDQLDRPLDQPVEFLNSTGQASTRSSWGVKDSSEGYVSSETDEYKKLLDTFRPVPNILSIERLDRPVCEVMAVSSIKNSIESSFEQTNSIELGAESKEQAQGDWSELKAPKVDLKPLPEGLRYAFLGENSTYPVIVNSDLEPEQLSALLVELRKYRKAIGYTLDDIKGISPDLCIHRIHLEDESKSSIEPQRRLNPNLKEVVKKEILKLLDAGIIYPISDSTWISPVHCVPKKGGITVIKNDKEELIPTRTIVGHRMYVRKIGKPPFYCFLDGYSGFFQIPIHPNDQEKTTFTCPYGTFAYRRMPFGLCNAPATFQRCMTSIFSDLIEEMVEVFMDDFSVYGASFSSCLSNLCRVLQRCEETNLVLNWEKCHFMLPVPKTVKDIRSFLGHAGFYRRFIKDFSKIARPLTRLLCKETDFEFDEECHKSWTLLKDALVSAPIVQAPNWDHPFEIMCDASDYAVGAVLGQKIDKKLNVIYYASKTMDDAQCKYATTEKELLAIVFAFEKFRSYIVGSKVIVHTDHAALRHIFAKKIQSQDFSDGSFCFKSLT